MQTRGSTSKPEALPEGYIEVLEAIIDAIVRGSDQKSVKTYLERFSNAFNISFFETDEQIAALGDLMEGPTTHYPELLPSFINKIDLASVGPLTDEFAEMIVKTIDFVLNPHDAALEFLLPPRCNEWGHSAQNV